MKKLRNNKITASRKLAAVPAHSCSYFIIGVSQAAAHWLQWLGATILSICVLANANCRTVRGHCSQRDADCRRA